MRALLLDCETTGLIYNHTVGLHMQPHVIEIYLCDAIITKKGFTIDREFEQLIKPPQPLANKSAGPRSKKTIESITGITDEMLKDAPPFAQVAERIFGYLEAAPLVIAHNASFDRECLDFEAERLGRSINWPRTLCTVEQTLHVKGHRLKLTELYELFFGEKYAAHRARADVLALLGCVTEMHREGWI